MKLSYFFFSLMLSALIVTSCQQAEDTTTETTPSTPSTPSTTENTTGMLQHTVYFYLNDDVSQEDADEFEEGLKKLIAIESVHKSELGVPGDTESRDVTDHSFGYSIFTWFENMDDYNNYADHPDHLEFIDTYNSLWADVKVYDSELIEK